MSDCVDAPFEVLPDELLQLIFALVDTKTLLTTVPAVCRRWRAVCGQTRNVHDLDFIVEIRLSDPARAQKREQCSTKKVLPLVVARGGAR